MPLSKNAFLRYRIIDSCLRDPYHHWTKAEITEKVNRELEIRYGKDNKISTSTIRQDLDTMQYTLKAPIERYPTNRPKYYKYADTDFSLFSPIIQPKDMAKLTRAMEILASVKGLELAEEIQPIIQYLQNRSHLHEAKQVKVMHFDHQPIADGAEYIEDLLESILQKTPLEFLYQPFTDKQPSKLNFHPYLLKEYNNRWFCIGYCSLRRQIMHIGLDRIKGKLKPLRTAYVENNFFDPAEYFTDIIGVTRTNLPKQKIVLTFSPQRAAYVKTKPLHRSQEILNEYKNGSIKVSIEVIPNNELIATLLSFGKDVQVVSPNEIKQELLNTYQACIAQYEKKVE